MGKREIHESYIHTYCPRTNVSKLPGGYINIHDVLTMKESWIRWPNGMQEYIPWSDGLSVEQLRYHIRRVRLLRTNLPWHLNIFFFLALFVTASLQAIAYNRAITQVIPKNCNEEIYSQPEALFPEPVREFYGEVFGLYNMSDHNKWYLGNWALIPARKAFCPVSIDLTAELYDARSGQVPTDDYAPSQVGVIKYCFRHDHDGNYDVKAFKYIDAVNEEDYGNYDSRLELGWSNFLSTRCMALVSIIFTFLATYCAWPTCMTLAYNNTLEAHFYRKDKLYHKYKGTSVLSNDDVVNEIHQEEKEERDKDIEMASLRTSQSHMEEKRK